LYNYNTDNRVFFIYFLHMLHLSVMYIYEYILLLIHIVLELVFTSIEMYLRLNKYISNEKYMFL